jgi:hypothetical protein
MSVKLHPAISPFTPKTSGLASPANASASIQTSGSDATLQALLQDLYQASGGAPVEGISFKPAAPSSHHYPVAVTRSSR